jgi:Transposase DDE domain group 1
VNAKIRHRLSRNKRRVQRRLDKTKPIRADRPVLTASNIHYEISDRVHGISHGGIGAFHLLAQRIGLVDAIDRELHLLKIHLPYHESDHVLNLAYNPLCNGACLQDIELRRNDVNFLDALGAERIPDPTTAGDFCRRFTPETINILQDVYDEVRVGVWRKQPAAFFDRAILDADGTLVPTDAEHKEGVDIAYDGTWGYHPLLVTLANTGEVMRLVNRPGNRPSHEGAADAVDRAKATCLRAGFRKILMRGDTDFSQTKHLDRWNDDGRVSFIFGYDARDNLKHIAEHLPESAWQTLQRRQTPEPKTGTRERAPNRKDAIVRQRQFETLRLQSEQVAEFPYRPTACKTEYRMVVVRKNISKEKGELRLFDEIVYFFYITNEWTPSAADIVLAPHGANGRCQQENTIQQNQGGVHALKAPVDTLVSNWAYMVMTSLAWNMKAWAALMLPETGRWAERYRADKAWLLGIEFKTFINALIAIPCQIVKQARRIVYRVLAYNPHQPIFFRLLDALHC